MKEFINAIRPFVRVEKIGKRTGLRGNIGSLISRNQDWNKEQAKRFLDELATNLHFVKTMELEERKRLEIYD